MKRLKVSNNFHLDEFVNPTIYRLYGTKSLKFIDNRVIKIAQHIRELTGKPTYINNWYKKGGYKNSGFRMFMIKLGARYSQHKYGRAIDIKVKGMTPVEVFELVMQHEQVFKRLGLTRIENPAFTKTWLHLDCATTLEKDIVVFNP